MSLRLENWFGLAKSVKTIYRLTHALNSRPVIICRVTKSAHFGQFNYSNEIHVNLNASRSIHNFKTQSNSIIFIF